jgi:protein-disulfide isomerase
MRKEALLLLPVLLLAMTSDAFCQTPSCEGLEAPQKELARELLASQYPYDCCDRPISECLREEPVCRLAYRLAESICRRVEAGESREEIVRGLSRRGRSMLPSRKPAQIDLSSSPMAGEPAAPVAFVVYACARCPFCSKIIPSLFKEISQGRLRGKARLYFKVFPIRGHEYSKEAGLGFVAAYQLGAFWPFMLYSYESFDHFCVKKQLEWAEKSGLAPQAFAQRVNAPDTRAMLVESKKEGLRNKVDATPTFFINGRKYVGSLGLEELMDVLEEEYERLTGEVYREGSD